MMACDVSPVAMFLMPFKHNSMQVICDTFIALRHNENYRSIVCDIGRGRVAI